MTEGSFTWRNPQQICLLNTAGEIVAWGYDRNNLQEVADWLNSDGEGFKVADGFADRATVPALWTWLEQLGTLDDFLKWTVDNKTPPAP